jgi:hypothetical protein
MYHFSELFPAQEGGLHIISGNRDARGSHTKTIARDNAVYAQRLRTQAEANGD